MSTIVRAAIAVGCGVVIILLEWKVFPVGSEPVVYWSLPFFHLIFHPLTSGPSPQAGLCAWVLNAVLVTAVVFLLLSLRRRRL
jgi:hypothetical protein